MPAVPPCLTEKIRSLCRVPSHSLPVTPASRLGYLANTVHLALGGPFTETASIRITPPRTLWETVPQFYFLVFGLFLFIWYGHILPFVFCAVNYFLKTFLCFFTNYLRWICSPSIIISFSKTFSAESISSLMALPTRDTPHCAARV